MKRLIIVMTLALSGCALLQKGVDQEDVAAWRGVPLSDLESHPEYSAMPLEKRELSNGDTIYNFRNSGGSGSSCHSDSYGNTNCTSNVSTCNHQFIVRKNMVVDYRPTGHCRTDCQRRPASRPCD